MPEMRIVCRPKVCRPVMAAGFGAAALFLGLLPTAHSPQPKAQGQLRTFFVPPTAATQPAALPDPLPLRRLLISPERLPFELQRARQGTLVQISRDDFEARVAEAARAGETIKNPPRLVEARYRAQLIDTALVGTGQWTVVNPGSAAGILPLQPLNLALRQVRFDKGEAVIGDLDGKSLGLLVERSGTHTVSVAWSARGDPGPGGLRFELKVPNCVLTSFDLELPADRTATLVGDNCLLAGPRSADARDYRTWRLQCGGSSPVDLLIRPASASSEPPPLVLARLRTKQKLAPDLVEADYDFNLEVLHGSIRELLCEGDPALHPTAVSIGSAEIETWEMRPGPTPGAPFNLWIQLPERFQGKPLSLHIHCLAPAAPKNRWTSPALRLKRGVLQGETLLLQLSPEVRLEDWQPGAFVITKSASEADGGLSLTLQSGLGGAPKAENKVSQGLRATSVRPSARIRVQEPEYRARQVAWWQIGPDTASLTVQIDYEVVRGQLFRLPILLPANWSLDRLDLSPADLLRIWIPLPPERGQTLLIVELQRPLESTATARVTLQLRPANAWPVPSRENKAKPSEFSVAFPEIHPQGAGLCDGALAIRIDPLYEATVRASSPAVAADKRIENRQEPRPSILDPLSSIFNSQQSPWGTQQPDYLYTFRGQAVSGTVKLRPRSPRIRAHCTSEIVLAPGRAAVLTRLLLQPDVGNPDTFDLLVSAPVSGIWNWRSEGGRNAVKGMQRLTTAEVLPRLLPLGAGSPLAAVSLLQPLIGRATWWRLTLDQPLREPVLLETTFDLAGEGLPVVPASRLSALAAATVWESLALAAVGSEAGIERLDARHWEVPLLAVFSAEPMDGEVQLYLAGAGVVQIETVGLGEMATASGAGVLTPWRTFRYSRLPVSLVLHGGMAVPDRSAAAMVERAHLRTYVEPAGRLLNYYSFQVRNWKQRTLPLRLPAGAQLLAAKVDGRWIPRPTLHETAEDGPVAELPVATEAVALCFEVVYALEYPAGTLWTHVHAPAPVLPVVAVASRRTWCLPAGSMPLYEGRFQRHPGPTRDFGDSAEGKAMSLSFLADPSAAFSSEEWRHRQERLLVEADARLRERESQDKHRSLGEALHYLTYEFLKGQEVLVLDAVALRQAGLRPATPIKEDAQNRKGQGTGSEGEAPLRSLESLGLVCIPCPPAPLLTTHRQWAAWQGALGRTRSVSDSVETAVSQAITHGHDPSGRFRSASDWLRDWNGEFETQHGGENGPGKSESALPGAMASLPHPESWTEWEPIAGLPGEETLVVLRQDTLWGIACSLSGMLLLAWWWARRHWARLCYGLTLFWLAASVLGLLWLPAALRAVFWWPMFAGIALAAAWYLVSALRSRTPARSTEPSAAAAAMLAVVLAVGLPGRAAAPAPYTVWLLPGPADAPEKLSALVPPELLDKLQSLARRGAAGLQGALLQSAKYQGTVTDGAADLQAEFQVHCFTDERTTLTLPLGGVELREALLDGSAAYPAALPPPQHGYTLQVQGRGAHTVRVHFVVRSTGTGEDQDLRCTIPELAQSQLTLRVPEGARYLQAVLGRGAQHASPDPMGVRLEADLGRVSSLHVHWRQESQQPPPAAVEVKEVYYWDLHWSGSRLLGLLDYTVIRGAVTKLAAVLPEGLEVRQVETVSAGAGGLWPRLKDWTLSGTGGQRRLRLEFHGPVTNKVQVLLELVPSLPLAHSAVLSLPTPESVSFGEGFFAYRVQGLQDSVADHRGVMEIEPAVFEPHWQPAGIEYPGLPERAYRFLRASGGAPFLRLDLDASAPRSECVQDLIWYLGPQQADLRATAKLTAPQKDLAFVEWEIPVEVMVADVRGAEVRNWSRTGARLQVWLQRSVVETTLELTGWVVRPANEQMAPFQLSCLAFPGAVPHTTLVRVVAEKGWALHAEQLHNLGALPEPRTSDRDQGYLSSQATYRGVFHLRPASAPTDLLTLSLLEVRDRRVAFNALLDYDIGPRKSRTLTVRLRNWKGQEVRLEAPHGVSRPEPRRDPLARTWTLELPPALTGHIQCQLTGTLALEGNAKVVMPEVSVDEAASSERWLAAVGQGLRPEEQRGLIAAADAAQALGRWPTAADRLRQQGGSVWRIDVPDWRLRLRTDFPLAESRPAQLFLDEQAAAILDGRRWLHEATYLLYQESGTHLGIRLPNGATLMMASLDGHEITPLPAGSERLWLPLTGGSGLRALRLRWVFSADREPLDLPRLEEPRLENILYPPAEQRSPTLWTVHVPPGYRVAHVGENALQGNSVERYLHHAAAQLLATGVLAERAAGKADEPHGRPLLTAQVRFYRHCREAEYALAFPERLRGGAVNIGSLAAKLRKLRADGKQLSLTHHFQEIRVQAEAQAASFPGTGVSLDNAGPVRSEGANSDELLAQQGTPTYWQVGFDGGDPQVRLVAVQTELTRQALGYSGLLLVLFLVAWILPSYPRAVAWLRASWPEQIVLLGGLAWLVRGEAVLFALLVFLGVAARLVYLGRWVVARLRRPAPAAAVGSGVTSAT